MIVYRELSSLARDLEVPARTLYAVSNSLDRHYRKVLLPKIGGGTRTLSVPDPLLKTIQRRINAVLLCHMPVSPYATAYRYGGSTLRNAQPHVGQPAVLKADIRHFFDSILYSAVKDAAFPAEIYAEPLRILLTLLCYYQDGLPQGAPSSPGITNLLLRDFDNTVGKWCRDRDIRYTRYCDDMTFSGSFSPAEVLSFLSCCLRREGFFLNEKKTRFLPQGRRQTVTGIVVNEKAAVPAQYRRKLRQELYFCQKYGVASHMAHLGIEGEEAPYLRHLLGQVNYALQISPEDAALLSGRRYLLHALAHRET